MMTDHHPSDTGTHRVSIHLGKVLFKLANTYPTLLLAVVEAAQNAIDADATQVLIAIDQQGSRVTVADNGTGVTVEKFGMALMSVGDSVKRKGSLGQFGIGLISPLNKCREFVFTSMPAGSSLANEWTFVGEDILKQRADIDIPRRAVPSIPAIPQPFKSTSRRLKTAWNSVVLMNGITQDRTIRTVLMDELEHHLRNKLSQGMRQKGTAIHVVINDENGVITNRDILPMEFTGEALPVVEYVDADCGLVVFKLYRAPKTRSGRKGEVVVMKLDDKYSFSWKEYRVQAMGSGFLAEFKEAFAVLESGYFEGIIYLENVTLAPERTKFNLDDALRTSYFVIDRWYREHGQQHYEEEQEARREERYKELGQKSLDRLYEKLAHDALLHSVLEELLGNLSKPEPRERSKTTTPLKKRRAVAEPSLAKKHRTTGDKPKPTPEQAPTTLRFAYEQLPGSTNLWEFDTSAATVVFNILHPVWVSLDDAAEGKRTSRHDKQITHLQTWVGFQVIMLLANHSDPDDFESNRHSIDEQVRPYASLFIEPEPRTSSR
jgi:hypothetical protein